MAYPLEQIFLPVQRMQLEHDEKAHRDILSFSLHKRLKHMVLHFYKYAAKVTVACESQDVPAARHALLDALIICLASANALNLSLGRTIQVGDKTATLDDVAHALAKQVKHPDVCQSAARDLLLIGGRMAKVVESADHMEAGDPRGDMARLVPELTASVLAHLGRLDNSGIEQAVRTRLAAVEQKSIFGR
ncbi:hypothetical protein [uncultured Hydrogenophaga sp.]|uniref:hypothetical protein n=1 Tax=uncultured Hydrogenophaga sp. TaxID=199683 RepID=UPI00258B2F3B|nr:hypothetical protein [uncultured Hydrogenophaga sp.]